MCQQCHYQVHADVIGAECGTANAAHLAGLGFPTFVRAMCVPCRCSSAATHAQAVSGQELGEREGAMATWWNQIVLPVGRMQDRVDAGVGGAR